MFIYALLLKLTASVLNNWPLFLLSLKWKLNLQYHKVKFNWEHPFIKELFCHYLPTHHIWYQHPSFTNEKNGRRMKMNRQDTIILNPTVSKTEGVGKIYFNCVTSLWSPWNSIDTHTKFLEHKYATGSMPLPTTNYCSKIHGVPKTFTSTIPFKKCSAKTSSRRQECNIPKIH